MNEEFDHFLDEITNNFSELFVETFLIRYLSMFDKKKIIVDYKKVKKVLMNKINDKFIEKITNI